jgi:mRNA interferase MazF
LICRRGDVVVGALPGDYGKPRPMLVIQADSYNGLSLVSDAMIDKIMTLSRSRIRQVIGTLSNAEMIRIDQRLLTFLGLA